MAKRKRDSKGRFVSSKGRSRSRSRRAKSRPRDSKGRFVSRRRSSGRRYRRNPVTGDVMGMFTGGVVEAGQILVGKAAARSIPDLVGLPKQGNVGLAIQAAVAVALGFAADRFMGKDAARAILAGGLTAPMETMVVAYNVPWLSTALSPVTASAEVGAYVRRSRGVSSYVPRRGVSSYVPPSRQGGQQTAGMGMYYS